MDKSEQKVVTYYWQNIEQPNTIAGCTVSLASAINNDDIDTCIREMEGEMGIVRGL